MYAWIDAIPLTRPKRNVWRDFSDGVLVAEVIAAYLPHLVEIHNYPTANSVKQKVYNFETLNQRVLKKLGMLIPRETIEDIVNCKNGAIESVLNQLQFKIAKYKERMNQQKMSSPSKDASPESARRPDDRQNRAHNNNMHSNISPNKISNMVDEEILIEKEEQIRELQETVQVLELKVAKLEQLLRLKDNKIQKLMSNAI